MFAISSSVYRESSVIDNRNKVRNKQKKERKKKGRQAGRQAGSKVVTKEEEGSVKIE